MEQFISVTFVSSHRQCIIRILSLVRDYLLVNVQLIEFDLNLQRSDGRREQKWKEKAKLDRTSTESEAAAEVVTNALGKLRVSESGQPHVPISSREFGNAQLTNQVPSGLGNRGIWKPKAYGTTSGGAAVVEAEKAPAVGTSIENKGNTAGLAAQNGTVGLSQLFKGNQIENFTVDNSTYTQAQIRATFYPKFENEKSDQEVFLYSMCFLKFTPWICFIGPNFFLSLTQLLD